MAIPPLLSFWNGREEEIDRAPSAQRFCPESFLAKADEPGGHGIFPNRQARAGSPPRIHNITVGSGMLGKPFQELDREIAARAFESKPSHDSLQRLSII
jgi:hypothetical protein